MDKNDRECWGREMKFSVIIPVYNCADKLHISVDSILNQTFQDFELILVNDGSKDDSLKVCRLYTAKDSRVKVLNQTNSGAGPARNNGIEQASGDYLVFCDADDFYEPIALKSFARATEKNPDIIISSYQEFKYSTGGEVIVCSKRMMEPQEVTDLNEVRKAYIEFRKQSVITAPWGKAYRRSVVVENEIKFANLRRCQDVAFNLSFYDHVYSVTVIPEITYNYQTPDDDSYLKKFPVNMFDIHKTIYQMTVEKLVKWDVLTDREKRFLDEHLMRDAIILLRLNFQNSWKLSKAEQIKLSRKILEDSVLGAATQTKSTGLMNKIIRYILRSKKLWLVNGFSWGTLIYQERIKV